MKRVIELGITELSNSLSHCVNDAYYGETVYVVTSHGNPKAILRGFTEHDACLREDVESGEAE